MQQQKDETAVGRLLLIGRKKDEWWVSSCARVSKCHTALGGSESRRVVLLLLLLLVLVVVVVVVAAVVVGLVGVFDGDAGVLWYF